jgi:hypothetical protein
MPKRPPKSEALERAEKTSGRSNHAAGISDRRATSDEAEQSPRGPLPKNHRRLGGTFRTAT